MQFEAPRAGYDFTPSIRQIWKKECLCVCRLVHDARAHEGSEANLSTMTMPASDVVLYAKWTPKTHTVKTYLTRMYWI